MQACAYISTHPLQPVSTLEYRNSYEYIGDAEKEPSVEKKKEEQSAHVHKSHFNKIKLTRKEKKN